MKKSFIAYYRVSTKQQGKSGLGLEAQRECVQKYCEQGTIIQEFTEVESGKINSRPQLEKAIQASKETGATLIIAKLDRLARNAAFILTLRDSGVEFIACDIPQANTLTIGIMALLAQQERELISERTKAALKAKKAQGVKLGTPANLTQDAREKGARKRREMALNNERNRRASAMISTLRTQGLSYRKIAIKLNESGFYTSTGKAFSGKQVERLAKRSLEI